jgi:hypothetical protein
MLLNKWDALLLRRDALCRTKCSERDLLSCHLCEARHKARNE